MHIRVSLTPISEFVALTISSKLAKFIVVVLDGAKILNSSAFELVCAALTVTVAVAAMIELESVNNDTAT